MASFCPPTMRIGPPDRHTGGPQKPRSPPTGAFCFCRVADPVNGVAEGRESA